MLYLHGFPEIEKGFKRLGILHIEYGILAALSESPGGRLTLSDLALLGHMSQSRLSHRLRPLCERGDVELTGSDEDRRVSYVTITTEGRRRIEQAAPYHLSDVRRVVFDHLTDEQIATLAGLLETMAAALCDHPLFTGVDA